MQDVFTGEPTQGYGAKAELPRARCRRLRL